MQVRDIVPEVALIATLTRPPVERILRDLTFYLRHDNDDHILSTIGRAVLGQVFDPSFYKP